MTICKIKAKRLKKISQEEVSRFCVGAHNVDDVIAGIVPRDKEPKLLVIDLFCGAGGTSTGFEMTDGQALELLKIQGFPSFYRLEGSQQDQKKFIGNSVVPVVVMAWALVMANNGWTLIKKTA